jgi:hypothetical protein
MAERPPIGALYEFMPNRRKRVTVIEHHERFPEVIKLKFEDEPEDPGGWYGIYMLGRRIDVSSPPNVSEGGRRLRKRTRQVKKLKRRRSRRRTTRRV